MAGLDQSIPNARSNDILRDATGSSWSDYNIARAWKLLGEKRMTPAGRAKLPADVVSVWKEHRPRVLEVLPQNRVIRFADQRIDVLSKVKRPALTP